MRRVALALAALAAAACAPAGTRPAPPGAAAAAGNGSGVARATAPSPADDAREAFIDSIISLMTLDEKVGQLTQWHGGWGETGPQVDQGGKEQIREGKVGSFLGMYGAATTRQLQEIALHETRLGIPILFAHDVIHGFRTIFPVPLASAASWDPTLVEQAARVAAVEATAYGIQWTFAPMVDIARDPRWGRVVEGSGEDPYLGSVMAAARVHGFQGHDLADSTTVMATAKHFVAYGAAEGGRDYNVADISERTLREVYLPPFHAAVDAGAGSVMAAFNEIAGVPMHANRALLTGVLRDEWGFDGVVVSDYTGIRELLEHGIGATDEDVGIAAIRAGVDVDMLSRIYLEDIPEAVRDGRLSESVVDEAVRRVLRAKYRLGLFDDPFRYTDTTRVATDVLTPDHRALARKIAGESMVLLKNQGVLPLRKDAGTVAVIGELADDARDALGSWAAAGRPEDAVTLLDGIRRAVAPGTRVVYEPGASVQGDDTTGFAAAVSAAGRADAVVLVLGEHENMSAEANSRASLDLPGRQLELAKRVIATGKPVVVVLMNGRPLAVPWLAEHAPAVLEAWFLGVEMGPAVANVLFGDVNPGGKLPITFPRATGQVPIYYAHKNTGRPPDSANHYTSKYIDLPWTPLYPFGYGLSYTTFSYGTPRLSQPAIGMGDSVTVEVTVTNTGKRAGAEVVQLYLRDDVASITRPVQELRGFRRILLEPGQSETARFTIGPDDLWFWGPDMRRVTEPGEFTVFIGGSSADTQQLHFRLEGP